LQKRVEALEQRGRVVVREALIEKLLDVKFTMLPYSRDPEPRRIEHVQSSSTVATRLDERAYDGGN
jgi:hypothetical protein